MRPIPRRVLRPFQQFVKLESSSGILLLACTAIALAWANSPWGETYFSFRGTELTVSILEHGISHSITDWINDGLMVIFFLLVGLEIKQELLVGELRSPRRAALPILAAAGGMLVPAGIYSFLNAGAEGARGWGIPMATDIAFSLGVLALLGGRAPLSLKVFLAAYAIADDLGAVLVIAIFYSGELSWIHLALAAGILAVLVVLNVFGVRHAIAYGFPGLLLWLAFLESGVHATVAGVLLAATIPARHDGEDPRAPLLRRMEDALHPWVSFLILPLFALANAGVEIGGGFARSLSHPVSLGVVLGLVLGKPIGVLALSWLAVRTRLAAMPSGTSWAHLAGAGILGGIGFTMALFVAGLAFEDEGLLVHAKVGILTASLIAGASGWTLLRVMVPKTER